MKYHLFTLLLLSAACTAPAVDSPKVYDNDRLAFSYPGNWDINDEGSVILIEEKFFFGLLPGTTTIKLSLNDDTSRPSVYNQIRDVKANIGGQDISGNLEFDWIDGDFVETYLIQNGDQNLRISIRSNEEKLKKVEPGIRLVLDSLNLS